MLLPVDPPSLSVGVVSLAAVWVQECLISPPKEGAVSGRGPCRGRYVTYKYIPYGEKISWV